MRSQFIATEDFITTEDLEVDEEKCPWAVIIIEVEGGLLAFESMDDYHRWMAQV